MKRIALVNRPFNASVVALAVDAAAAAQRDGHYDTLDKHIDDTLQNTSAAGDAEFKMQLKALALSFFLFGDSVRIAERKKLGVTGFPGEEQTKP